MALDQLKKAEKECDQSEDKNATLKQKVTQLEAVDACNIKNVDNTIAAAGARIKEGKSKLRDRLA
nr:unnamed protein product [Callosobruchus chinensis]